MSFDVARTVGCTNKAGKVVKTSRGSTGFTSVEFTAGPVPSDGTMANNWVAYYDGGGHTPMLLELTYSNIVLSDNTNGITATAVPSSVTDTAQ